jgi:hypothetical protein
MSSHRPGLLAASASGGVGDSTPAAGQAGRATVMAGLFKDVNAGSVAMSNEASAIGARRRAVTGAALIIAAGLIVGGCSSGSGSPSGSDSPSGSGSSSSLAAPVWLCRPGQAADPCAHNLAASAVTAGGALKPATWPHSGVASEFDCFYVHPTDSLAKTANTGPEATEQDIGVAIEEAAPLSQACQVWAPAYRSQTFSSVKEGLAGDQSVMRSTFTVAYDSVLHAWQWFLAHTDGKPIVLVGDSQGSAVLIHLISAQIDHQPAVLRRLVVAILVGGNLQVPAGKTAGATLTKVPLCTTGTETGCAIAYSSYPSQPPPDSMFGRPGQGTSLQSGQTAKAGQQVACVNPAALGGGTADLDPYLLTVTQTAHLPGLVRLTEPVSTPWVTYPRLYSASCQHGGGATWLQVTSLAGTSRARPVVNENIVGNYGGGTGPAWGYHVYEYGLTLGNLLHDMAGEEAAWQSGH